MIPIAVFLIPYTLFLLVFLFFSFVNIYHLIHFGRATGIMGFFATFLFLAITVLILNTTYLYAIGIDWSQTFNLFSAFLPSSSLELAP